MESNREELRIKISSLNRRSIFTRAMARFRRGQALCTIEDKDVWQALIHEVPGHGQGPEVGRDGYLASFHNLAFEFFG